ncbi:hypothetical protein ACIBCA_01520 [Kitasatospora sp. NPDC051170]|uniref:hypothetical protein n=1 Tax=Kitasatospora sp. NPDC051170 TaxID=3364056 RepID=UPI003790AE72
MGVGVHNGMSAGLYQAVIADNCPSMDWVSFILPRNSSGVGGGPSGPCIRNN